MCSQPSSPRTDSSGKDMPLACCRQGVVKSRTASQWQKHRPQIDRARGRFAEFFAREVRCIGPCKFDGRVSISQLVHVDRAKLVYLAVTCSGGQLLSRKVAKMCVCVSHRAWPQLALTMVSMGREGVQRCVYRTLAVASS